MQTRREIIREASGGYNELSKKEKMARFRFRGSRYHLQAYYHVHFTTFLNGALEQALALAAVMVQNMLKT
jgi:hypothetical protein